MFAKDNTFQDSSANDTKEKTTTEQKRTTAEYAEYAQPERNGRTLALRFFQPLPLLV